MQPCFAAIAHGCAAARHDESFSEVYSPRVRRGSTDFATRRLGLYGAELSSLAQFFEQPFATLSRNLSSEIQALVLNLAGSRLRALGRLAEAVEPMRAALDLNTALPALDKHSWEQAALNASNLSQLLLTLGRVAEAERVTIESVRYADLSGDTFQRMATRTARADALHQAGNTRRAMELFAEAERLQAESQPSLPRLYYVRGYQFSDLLLTQGRVPEVRAQYDYLVSVRDEGESLLDRALEELLAGRVHATLVQNSDASPASAERDSHAALAGRHLDDAVARLIAASSEDHIPRGFIARAGHRRWLYASTGEEAHLAGADQDLKDAEEIARRDEPNGGAMRLFLTDIALERCRLNLAQIARGSRTASAKASAFGMTGAGSWIARWFRRKEATTDNRSDGARGSDPEGLTPFVRLAEAHWKQAADLVKETGYHRRDGELAELRRQLDGLAG